MLIVLEGLDGAGKSTQIKKLQDYFENSGKVVKYLHFPRFDAPMYGELISKFLRGDFGDINEVHPMLVAMLYAGDRGEAAEMIRSWLSQGVVVVLDRYIYSNIAFQCAKVSSYEEREALRDWIFETEYNFFKIPVPDLNLFLDVPLLFVEKKLSEQRIGSERAYLEGKRDIHENDLSFQERVREIYLNECERDSGLVRIDCHDSEGKMADPEVISAKIIECLGIV